MLEVESAAVLDGAHLWVTLDAPCEGRIVAEHATDGQFIFDVGIEPGLRTVVLPLNTLPSLGEARYKLLFRHRRGLVPLGIGTESDGLTMSPPTPDGRWQYGIDGDAGRLELERLGLPESVPVHRVGLEGDAIEIRWQDPSVTRFALIERHQSAVLPVRVETSNVGSGVLLPGDLDIPVGGVFDAVVARSVGGYLPLRRARNELVKANACVVLPSVTADGTELRLRWRRAGLLQVRRRNLG